MMPAPQRSLGAGLITESQIRELFPRAPEPHVEAFARDNPALFSRFGIDASPTRLSFFLAQVGHEAGGLTVTEENLSYSPERMVAVWPSRFADVAAARPFARNPEALANHVYGGRMGNGPADTGDGFRFRGRGYIQITGRDGYAKVGAIAGLDLVAEPDRAHDPDQALLVACAFWEWKGLNLRCDTGDFVRVTRRTNGGTTGMADRRAWLDKARRVLNAALPDDLGELPAATIIAVQRALQSRRFSEVGAADGKLGPRTAAGIVRFRQETGLPESPPALLIDDDLLQALG